MNRNQKIALGCGGAGCLGLILLVILGGIGYFVWARQSRSHRDYDFNVSTNKNSNSDTDANRSAKNSNSDSDSKSGSNSSSASSLSDDEKHKLYQAASMTGDAEMLRRVTVKLGLTNEDFTPSDDYASFLDDHRTWAENNGDFILSMSSREKAVAYVNEHFPE